jgi:RNA ligase
VDLLTGVNIVADPLTWPGPVRQKMPAKTLAEALALKPRPNAEGVVVHALEGDRRVKIKQEDYILLHRIITGLNARSVWEVLKDPDKDLIELYSAVPDEFHHWISDVAEVLTNLVDARYEQVVAEFYQVQDVVSGTDDRKGFAQYTMANYPQDSKYMFALLDGRSIDELLWNEVKPAPDWSPVTQRGEDVA